MAELPPDYVARLFQIESGGNPAAVTGSNRGLGQFGPAEEAQYGITDANRSDPEAQRAAVLREAQAHQAVLARALGRDPTAGELYLMHQQGIAGAPALLTADPSKPAWQVIRPYYRSDAIAKQAISGNVPGNDPMAKRDVGDITAGDFSRMWVSRFEGGLGQGGAPAAGGAQPAPPAAVAANVPQGASAMLSPGSAAQAAPASLAPGMLSGQLTGADMSGAPQQSDPNLDLLIQRARAVAQEQPAAPPVQQLTMAMPRGMMAARLRAAALGRGLRG